MKKLKKNLPLVLEMLMTITIVGLVYIQAVRIDYRQMVENTMSTGHATKTYKTQASGE